jgi:hypothetical protein
VDDGSTGNGQRAEGVTKRVHEIYPPLHPEIEVAGGVCGEIDRPTSGCITPGPLAEHGTVRRIVLRYHVAATGWHGVQLATRVERNRKCLKRDGHRPQDVSITVEFLQAPVHESWKLLGERVTGLSDVDVSGGIDDDVGREIGLAVVGGLRSNLADDVARRVEFRYAFRVSLGHVHIALLVDSDSVVAAKVVARVVFAECAHSGQHAPCGQKASNRQAGAELSAARHEGTGRRLEKPLRFGLRHDDGHWSKGHT